VNLKLYLSLIKAEVVTDVSIPNRDLVNLKHQLVIQKLQVFKVRFNP